jgi:hypothetical protein
MRGNQILYSQSVMVINANANSFTYLSCSQWEDTTFGDTCYKRQVNVVLGNLMCLHYPGEVPQSTGASSAATYWVDYDLSLDATYETAQGAVWNDFWLSFLVTLFQSFIPDV